MARTTRTRFGGSFAPRLDEESLARYEQLAQDADPQVRDGMEALITMLRRFWETGRSRQAGRSHPSGVGTIVPLEEEEVERIWDVVPWLNAAQREQHGRIGDDDCDQYGRLFDRLTGEMRAAAYHLLWYARELALDREPITSDTV